MTIYAGTVAADGVPRCAACRRDQRPLWRRWGRLFCASCLTRRLCAGGSLEPIAFYAKPTGGPAAGRSPVQSERKESRA